MVPSATRSRISALKSTSQLCRRTPTPSRQSGTLEGSTFRGNDGEPLPVDLAVGSRVAGLVAGFDRDFGTYAEQLVVPARDTALVPDGLDLVTAPRSRSTAWPQPSSSTCSATAEAGACW